MFTDCLGNAIGATGDEDAAKINQLILAPDSLRKRLAMRILEHRAELYLHDNQVAGDYRDATGAIDWSKVPWQAILLGLVKVLVALLPLLLV